MTRSEKVKLLWECTLGKKSHMNIAGKIILFPLIVIFAVTISMLEFLFSKDDEDSQ